MADMDSAPLSSASAGFDRRRHSNRRDFPARVKASTADDDLSMSCLGFALVIWFFVAVNMIIVVYGPDNVWIGPNSSILIEPNPIFVQSVKAKDLDNSKSGLELFGFNTSPPLDVFVNWSESYLASVSRKSYKVWPFYLNEGASLNISLSVKPEGRSVQLVVDRVLPFRDIIISRFFQSSQFIGMADHSDRLLEKPANESTALSWNLIRGSGSIEVKISKSSSYYVAVANSNMKDVEVELDIDVRAVLYDTKQSFYKCTFINGECTSNAMSLVGNSIVLTSPALRQGASVEEEEEEWNIRFLYQPRWTSYAVVTGLVTCFMLAAIVCCKWLLQCLLGAEGCLSENDSARTRLLANKNDDVSSMDSSNGSLAEDDAEMEDVMGNEGNGARRVCAICLDAPRNCFFMPCGHCVSCYRCGKKISQDAGSCPICRRKMTRVKRIYTV